MPLPLRDGGAVPVPELGERANVDVLAFPVKFEASTIRSISRFTAARGRANPIDPDTFVAVIAAATRSGRPHP